MTPSPASLPAPVLNGSLNVAPQPTRRMLTQYGISYNLPPLNDHTLPVSGRRRSLGDALGITHSEGTVDRRRLSLITLSSSDSLRSFATSSAPLKSHQKAPVRALSPSYFSFRTSLNEMKELKRVDRKGTETCTWEGNLEKDIDVQEEVHHKLEPVSSPMVPLIRVDAFEDETLKISDILHGNTKDGITTSTTDQPLLPENDSVRVPLPAKPPSDNAGRHMGPYSRNRGETSQRVEKVLPSTRSLTHLSSSRYFGDTGVATHEGRLFPASGSSSSARLHVDFNSPSSPGYHYATISSAQKSRSKHTTVQASNSTPMLSRLQADFVQDAALKPNHDIREPTLVASPSSRSLKTCCVSSSPKFKRDLMDWKSTKASGSPLGSNKDQNPERPLRGDSSETNASSTQLYKDIMKVLPTGDVTTLNNVISKLIKYSLLSW